MHPQDFSNEELVNQLNKKCKKAFDIAYDIFWKAMYKEACKMLRDNVMARDVVQEVFMNLYLNMGKLNPEVPLKNWLLCCVKNRIVSYIRRKRVEENYMTSLTQKVYHENNTDKTLLEKELQVIIDEEIACLPPRMRLNFELSRKEQLSTIQIAILTATSAKTVQKQVFKALTKLKSKLSPLLYLVIICHSINIFLVKVL
jgi:RNA polymerase sigma-70 factor (ECF subfamily)